MGYISVDVDIDDLVDAMSPSEKRVVAESLTNNDLTKEVRRRGMQLHKSININRFTLESNVTKREHLIKLLDLPSYANDEAILKAVRENI